MAHTYLYEILGVPLDATTQDIKQAYKAQAKKLHPDAGGDEKEFAELLRAYTILRDPKSRARYDELGDDQVKTVHEEPFAMDTLAQVVRMVLGGQSQKILGFAVESGYNDFTHKDLLKEVKACLNEGKKAAKEIRQEHQAKAAHLQKILDKLKYHPTEVPDDAPKGVKQGASMDPLGAVIRNLKSQHDEAIEKANLEEAKMDAALQMAAFYVFEYTFKPQPTTRVANAFDPYEQEVPYRRNPFDTGNTF